MKPREQRRNVIIPARIRVAGAWGDICILNISTRGLLIHAADPPARGTYLDVRRGQYAIVARVIWAGDHRFGVSTQEPLAVEAIIRQPDPSTDQATSSGAASPIADAREAPRRAEVRHEASRMLSRRIEFAVIALFAASAAVGAYAAVKQALWRPLDHLSSAMARR